MVRTRGGKDTERTRPSKSPRRTPQKAAARKKRPSGSRATALSHQQLFDWSEDGSTDRVRTLVSETVGLNVNWHNEEKRRDTPLHVACRNGHEETVRVLLDAGASVKETNNSDFTPLFEVANRTDSGEITKALLNAGADVGAFDCKGSTAMHWAAERGHSKVVGAMLAAGADANIEHMLGNTPLSAACLENHIDTAKMLLEAGAKVNKKDMNNMTALHSAVVPKFCWGAEDNAPDVRPELVRLLHSHGADLNVVATSGKTPLLLALGDKTAADTVRELLKVGARTDIGNTAEELAAWKEQNEE